MKIYQSLRDVPRRERTVATIGTFDGIHRGHHLIIDALTAQAGKTDGRALVITFHPHPQEVLRRTGDSVPILTTIEERIAELEKLDVDALAIVRFTPEFAAIPWRDFCDMLIREIGVGHIVMGHDHAFGKNREGNAASLRKYGEDGEMEITEIGPLIVRDEAVSSTKIRRALLGGDIVRATEFLGRNYAFTGTVIRGDGRGRSLGIPTANIRPLDETKLIPANGVYCVRLIIGDRRCSGMANIGVRPTFTDGTERTIEVNIFDFDQDIYDATVTVEFLKFVRSERKFGSGAEFMQQLELDHATCRE
ncbi:MAG: Riboflavin biosynthesis protein [Chlorobi bacterium]|nr:Riboflavin biosynthesis protein [Chlorobiota bacterium]